MRNTMRERPLTRYDVLRRIRDIRRTVVRALKHTGPADDELQTLLASAVHFCDAAKKELTTSVKVRPRR